MVELDDLLVGRIARRQEEYLVPLIFEPYAEDLANRLSSRTLSRVLEIAAGTGVVTRHLASALPERVSIVATDLNQPMLDMASEIGASRPVDWRQADAMQLPFARSTRHAPASGSRRLPSTLGAIGSHRVTTDVLFER